MRAVVRIGLIVRSVSCHNTISYSSVYTLHLQSTLETSVQTLWSAMVDYGDIRCGSNPEARDIGLLEKIDSRATRFDLRR